MKFFDRFIRRKEVDPGDYFEPGIYKRNVTFSNGVQRRMHLRVESDFNGIFWLNGNESFYLNESASFFTWCVLTGKSDKDAKKLIAQRFPKNILEAQNDYEAFTPIMQAVCEGRAGSRELCESGIDLITPFSKLPDAPYRMDLALTYGCNNNCAHCYNEPGRAKNMLTFEQWKSVLDKLDQLGIPHIVFTGGEPTLVPFLPELVSYADKLGIVSGMNTNGRLLRHGELTAKLAERSLDHVQVTLESIHPDIHDAMVGAKGAWEETVAGIKMALKHNIYLNTNTTLLKDNASVEEINALSDFLHELGVKTMCLNALIYSGKGKNVGSGLRPEELPALLDAAKSAVKRNGQRLLWYTPTQYCHFDPVQHMVGFKSCSAAKYSMCIEPDGSVLPCQSWYDPVGNILTDPWEKIWNAPICDRLRNKRYMPEACSACETKDVCSCGCPLELEQNAELVQPRMGLPDCF